MYVGTSTSSTPPREAPTRISRACGHTATHWQGHTQLTPLNLRRLRPQTSGLDACLEPMTSDYRDAVFPSSFRVLALERRWVVKNRHTSATAPVFSKVRWDSKVRRVTEVRLHCPLAPDDPKSMLTVGILQGYYSGMSSHVLQ